MKKQIELTDDEIDLLSKFKKDYNDILSKEMYDYVKNKANSKEFKRFSIKSFFNSHITLIQDFNGIATPYAAYSYSGDDEYPNVINITILCWTIEISW